MTEATEHIRALIARAGGALRFDRYMAAALYGPGFGYYETAEQVFGEAGDFTTASEITPLYARAFARALAPQIEALSAPRLLELGGGTGRFAADLIGALPEAAQPSRYVFVEISPALRARQRRTIATALPGRSPPIESRTLAELAPEPTIVIANEVLDALPVRRIVVRPEGLGEQYVGDAGDRFEFVERRLPVRSAQVLSRHLAEHLPSLPSGYVIDLNTRIAPLVAALGRLVTRGAIWLADYGETRREYLHPGRVDGTLVCHHRHSVNHEPLARPGAQDITAAVDFTRVAEAATAVGLEVSGYATQAHVLVNLGLDALLAGIEDDDARIEAATALKTLVLPGQMGERIKIMALTRGLPRGSTAFARFDMAHRL